MIMTLKTKNLRWGNVRAVLISLLMAVMLACSLLAFIKPTSKTTSVNAKEIFTFGTTVDCQKNVAVDGVLPGTTGYKFSTSENETSILLADKMSGDFDISFVPISSQRGINDFERFYFLFSEEGTRLSFRVDFSPLSNGVLMKLTLSNNSTISKEIITEGSFSNLSNKPIKFSFDPDTMVIKTATGTVLADLQDPDTLATFNTVSAFEPFTEYSVEMRMADIKTGKKAQVVIFNIAGQSLAGQVLTDTANPVIVGAPVFDNAIVNQAYKLDTSIRTFDVIDGYKDTFNGRIEVLDYNNNPVQIVNNAFTPTSAQKYKISYIPVDLAGNEGDAYETSVIAFDAHPEIEFDYEFTSTDITIGKGAIINFPGVEAKSDLMVNSIPVVAKLTLNGEVVPAKQIDDVKDGFSYEFTRTGTYTLEYSAKDSANGEKKDSFTITVTNDKIFENFDLDTEYKKGANIDLTSVVVRGEENFASIFAVYPDGRTYKDFETLVLDIEGEYVITATAKTDGGATISETRYLNVKTDNAYLWEAVEGLTVTSNVTAPSYADYPYNGTKLTATRPLKTEYANVINLKDNTKDDLLFEAFVSPTEAGIKEINKIDFKFTDLYDEDNYIIVRLQWGVWEYYSEKTSVLSVRNEDYEFGLGEANPEFNNAHNIYYKYLLNSSLFGKVANANASYPSQKVSFYFDYETGKLYATPASTTDKTIKALIGDFTDTRFNYVGDNPFTGFTTGECKLTVGFSSLQAISANLMVLNIDGQSMSGQYNEDTTAPSVFVDFQGNQESNLPKAKVGEYFNIFGACARDITGGLINNVLTKVYKQVGDDEWVEIAKETTRFMPDAIGQYKIVYTATDTVGNVGTKEVIVEATDVIQDKVYIFSNQNPTNVIVGHEAKIYSGKMMGGSGALTEIMKLTLNGQEIAVDKYNCFTPTKAGTYVIEVQVKDYIGVSEVFRHNITATYADDAVLDEVTVPSAIRAGAAYELPKFTATAYSDAGATPVKVDTYIDGVLQTGTTYTPESAGQIILTAKHGEYELASYTIAVNKYDESVNKYISQFFYSNQPMEATTNGIVLKASEDAFIDVTEKISVDFIRTSFSVLDGDYAESFDYVITDSVDPTVKVTIRITRSTDKTSFMTLCGKQAEISGAFSPSGVRIDSELVYDNAKNNFTFAGISIGSITKLDNGKDFEGFPSGEVYIAMKVNGVEQPDDVASQKPVQLIIKNIAGQVITSTLKYDRGKPMIKILGENSRIEINEKIKVFPIVYYDFLSDIVSATVQVTAPGGTVLITGKPADQLYEVQATTFGTYTIIYDVRDSSGQFRQTRVAVQVANRQPPVITVDGTIPEAVKVGTEISIPSATVSASTQKYEFKIFTLSPWDEYLVNTTGKVKFDKVGTWYINYYAQDSGGVVSLKMFKVVVVA